MASSPWEVKQNGVKLNNYIDMEGVWLERDTHTHTHRVNLSPTLAHSLTHSLTHSATHIL